MPDRYVAVSHVVTSSVKKLPIRLSACWTPVSGSFDSIVEEDEELEDDLESEGDTSNRNVKCVRLYTLKCL